jgi:hypothetical protein
MVYIIGELWGYWRAAFPCGSIDDIFISIICDIDDKRAEFTRSLAWRGHLP